MYSWYQLVFNLCVCTRKKKSNLIFIFAALKHMKYKLRIPLKSNTRKRNIRKKQVQRAFVGKHEVKKPSSDVFTVDIYEEKRTNRRTTSWHQNYILKKFMKLSKTHCCVLFIALQENKTKIICMRTCITQSDVFLRSACFRYNIWQNQTPSINCKT